MYIACTFIADSVGMEGSVVLLLLSLLSSHHNIIFLRNRGNAVQEKLLKYNNYVWIWITFRVYTFVC